VTLIFLILVTFLYFGSHNLKNFAKQKFDLKTNILQHGKSLPSVPSTPVIAPVSAAENIGAGLTVPSGLRNKELEATEDITVDLPIFGQGDTGATPRVKIQDPPHSKDEDDDVKEISLQAPEKGKKKTHRGRRGGREHKRKKNIVGDETRANIDRVTEDMKHPQTQASPEPEYSLVRTTSTEIIEADGALRIGQLRVYTDKVLGHGSHGTVVYKGSFDGRDVAVKRMLVEFYDVASHEVGLLQESDDHSNVIRYFCREQTSGFLYIALELCPASLQEVVEKPSDYPSLVNGGLDLPDILRQITAGVRHLHSLKIVHRDLKPQNILVAAPKPRTGSNALRLLISDFGLCKKLEDNQSSFRATTAHAAGTSGWRAPELLVDDDLNPPIPSNWENQSADSSEPAVVDPQTNRRATRAIDIFSLGCVFYYVLTRGGHPFDKDGKFMREANIVKGYHNLDDLQRLGDYAFEADDLIRQMLSLDPHRR
jgi:serine/threonine-protein kinase/endoribonuclease IRE1